MPTQRELLTSWAQQNPGLVAGLETAISRAEGTWRNNKPGYNIQFGGGTFNDFSQHPNTVIRTPGYASAAAGAFQFMPSTWKNTAAAIGAKDFGPENQRLGMLHLVRQRLMPVGGLAALTKAGTLTPELQAYLAPEWASFPTNSGQSAYGQPVKKAADIQSWFNQGAKTGLETTQTTKEQGNNLSSSDFLQGFMSAIAGYKPKELSMEDLIKQQMMAQMLKPPSSPYALSTNFLLDYLNPYG